MYLDFKVTAWERIEFKDSNSFNKIKDYIKKNKRCTHNDIQEFINFDGIEFLQIDVPTEPMTVEQNDGDSTLEIMEYKDGTKHLITTASN